MKKSVQCLLLVLLALMARVQCGPVRVASAESANLVRMRRAPFLSFPGGGFGVGVRYEESRYRSIPGFTFERYNGYYGRRAPDAYANFSE